LQPVNAVKLQFMKKIKFFLLLIAIVAAVVGAFATRSGQGCTSVQQYYWDGTNYVPAGVLGLDYYCASGAGTCTYITAGNFYQPCQSGIYMPLNVKAPKK